MADDGFPADGREESATQQQNFPPPGGVPPQPGMYPPPGAYPGPGPGSAYAGVPVGAPPVAPGRPGPALLSAADLLPAARDGLLALAAAFVMALLAVVLVVLVGFNGSNVHVGFGDYFSTALWLTASSLGAPLSGSISESMNLGSDTSGLASGNLSFAMSLSLRLTVWLLTIIVLLLTYRFARQREREAPSFSLGQVVARAALPAVAVSAALLILALVTRRSDPFGAMGYLNGSTGGTAGLQGASGSLGIDTPLVFLGPLLLVFALALLARLGVWIHLMSADPHAMRMRTQFGRWTPSFRVAWLQMRVIGTLVAVGIWVYLAYEVISQHELSHGGVAALLAGLFLLPNFAVYGTFMGFGVTLYASVTGLGALFSGIAATDTSGSGSDGGVPTNTGASVGLFGSDRPWGVWLLLLAVLIGTLAPAVLARRGGRFAVNPADYRSNGAWRSVLLGIVTALVVTLLGALSLSVGVGMGGGTATSVDGLSVTEAFGPSLLGAIGLTALWFLLSYMAVSLALQNAPATAGPNLYQGPYHQDPYQQPVQPTQPLPQRNPGPRPKYVIPLVVVLVLAVCGAVGYHLFVGKSLSGPEAVATSYFQDIEAGDAADASALAVGPYPDTPVVSAATLANAADRPSDFSIVSSTPASSTAASGYATEGVTGTNLTFVVVKYVVDGSTITDTYVAEQDSTTSKWLLFDPYQELSVSGGWSSTATVDGVSFDASSPVDVFPGAHVVSDPSSPDFSSTSTIAYPADQSAGGSNGLPDVTMASLAQVTLPEPTLSAAGQSAAQAAYSTALTACASQADTGYSVCGIDDTYDYFTCNSVAWTITTVGTAQVDLTDASGDGSFDLTASGSVASESGDYTDYSGTDQTFSNQTTDLQDSSGTIVFNSDGTATVTLSS